MAIRFDELKDREIKLSPVEVPIEGLEEPVEIQQFSWAEFESLLEVDESQENNSNFLAAQTIKLMRGLTPEPTEAEIKKLKTQFGLPVIRKIYTEGLAVNGMGKKAEDATKKN